jgi:tripartite-type tricarboxylate transporter receptor subunit TctC
LLSNISDAVAVALGVKLTYDFQKDLTPIILLGDTPFVLIAGSGIKVSSVKELIEFCKNNPGKVNFGSSGTGSASQLAGELFISMAGCSATHVPYKGQSDATMALMGGQLTFAFANPVPALPQIKSGALRALAVSSKTSYRSLPDTPTVNQDGLAGFDVSPWFGLVTPGKTPAVVIARLQNELAEILTRPEIQEKLFRLGVQAKGGTSADFASLIASDITRWKKVAQDANIKVE